MRTAKLIPLTEAARELAAANVKLAFFVAGRYRRRWCSAVDLDVLESAACEGLIIAAARYEPARGTGGDMAFVRFASLVIEQRVRLAMRKELDRRQRWRQMQADADPPADASPNPEIPADMLRCIYRVLPHSYHAVFAARHVEGLGMVEIGARTGVTSQAISERLRKAYAIIRRMLPQLAP